MREQQVIIGGFAFGGIFESKLEDSYFPRPVDQHVEQWRRGRGCVENPRSVFQRKNWENLQAPLSYNRCTPRNAFDMS